MRLGIALHAAGDLARATSVLRDGVERWPHNLAGQVALGRVLASAGDVEDAEAVLTTVLQRSPEHWTALDALAALKRAAGDRAAERDLLTRLARQSPGDRRVARRLDLAERQLASRPAPASPTPGMASTAAPPGYASAPTHAMKAVTRTTLANARVTTTPSAAQPQRSRTTEPSAAAPRLLRRSEVRRTNPGHRPAQPGIRRDSRPAPAADPFANLTMVELLVDQGRNDDARAMLSELIRREPGKRSLVQRLLELGGEKPDTEKSGTRGPAELEALMRGVLQSAAVELEALTEDGPITGESEA